MRVMVLGLRGFPDVQGGVEKHAEQLYPLLIQAECQVDVIARSTYTPKNHRAWKGITIHRIWAPRLSGVEALMHSVFGVLYAAIKRPDVLHIHAIGPAIVTPLARLLRLRVVVTHHGPDYDREKWGYMARWLLRLGEKWGMCYATRRIVITKIISDLVEQKYNVDTTIIPNGVMLPEIPVTKTTLEKYGLDAGRYVLLVSRFVPEKRHLDLIHAFNLANLENWKLVLVGDLDHLGGYSRKIIAESNKFPRIVLTGFQSGLPLAEIYANAGVFVLPSSHEGLPIAMLEAMSYGLPVFASDIPANVSVGLSRGNYFPLGDIAYLAKMLKEHVVKEGSGDVREENRKIICEKYNWDKIAQDTLNIYQQAIKSQS